MCGGADEKNPLELSEVLITEVSTSASPCWCSTAHMLILNHLEHFQLKKHLMFYHVPQWEAESPTSPLTWCLGGRGGAGALHSLFTCKEMEISAGALYWCQRWPAAIWPLYSFWHPLLPTSFGLKLWHEVAACRVDRTESTMGWINVFKPAICFSLFLTT